MDSVSISEFKATCLAKLDYVKRTGRPLNITRRGELIAQVIPPPPPDKPASWLGCFAATVKIHGDLTGPVLAEEEWKVLNS